VSRVHVAGGCSAAAAISGTGRFGARYSQATDDARALLRQALNGASSYWLRAAVWMDFRFAVAFFVATPLALLVSSAFEESDTSRRLLFGYWQVCETYYISCQ